MRRRGLILVVAAAAAFLVVRGFVAWRDTSGRVTKPAPSTPAVAAFPTRTSTAGAITVKIQPRRVDSSGAEFAVSFDTHSVDLGLDVAANAHLTVGRNQWTTPVWSGDGPGGHHRAGTVGFTSAGPPAGAMTLHLSGLASQLSTSWRAPER